MTIQNQMMETDAKLYYTDVESFIFQMKSEDLARGFVQRLTHQTTTHRKRQSSNRIHEQ